MANVSLQFTLPAEPDIAELRIWESATPDGTFELIDTTTNVGTFPNYITHYTTSLASSPDDWFSIQWLDSKGAASDMSEPWKGGEDSLVNQVADRVVQRDSSMPGPVVIQEAEAAIEQYFGEDPYLVDEDALGSHKYRILSGLTYLVLARSMIVKMVRTSVLTDVASVTLGLVTMRTGSGSSTSSAEANIKQIESLLDLANSYLGISLSVVAEIEEMVNTYGQASVSQQQWLLQ